MYSVHKILLFNLNFFFLEPPLVRVNHKEIFQRLQLFTAELTAFTPQKFPRSGLKNGEEIVQEMDYGDLPPGGDGTYQTWVSVELDPQSSNLYSCHVEHSGVHVVLQGSQGREGVVAV